MKLNTGVFCLTVLYLLPAVAQSRRLGGKRVKNGKNDYFEVLEADELDAFGLTFDQEESAEFWIRHLQASFSIAVLPTAPPTTVAQPLPQPTSPPPTMAQTQPKPTSAPTVSALAPPTPPPTTAQPQPQPTPPPTTAQPQPQPTLPPTAPLPQPTQAPADVIDRCAAVTCTNPIEGCDPLDGQCKPIDAAVPCIAIIDESSQSDSYITGLWTTFRTQYPDRPFCLLRPIADSVSDRLFLPPDFVNDERTTYAEVSRDDLGDKSVVPGISDWFNICGLGIYQGNDIQYIGKFLDTSGSMTLSTVAASNDLFLANVRSANLEVREVTNRSEDWITPFLTTLAPSSGRRTALRRSLSQQ